MHYLCLHSHYFQRRPKIKIPRNGFFATLSGNILAKFQPKSMNTCCKQTGNMCLMQYCAKVMQANFDKFLGFSKKFHFKRNFRDFSANFQGTYCFIPPELSNDNSRWTLMSQEILRESSLFSIVSCEIAEENLLWLMSVLIETKRNTATVRDLLLRKEM